MIFHAYIWLEGGPIQLPIRTTDVVWPCMLEFFLDPAENVDSSNPDEYSVPDYATGEDIYIGPDDPAYSVWAVNDRIIASGDILTITDVLVKIPAFPRKWGLNTVFRVYPYYIYSDRYNLGTGQPNSSLSRRGLFLSWSDNGRPFNTPIQADVGARGQRKHQISFFRLGRYVTRQWKIEILADTQVVISALEEHVVPGRSQR